MLISKRIFFSDYSKCTDIMLCLIENIRYHLGIDIVWNKHVNILYVGIAITIRVNNCRLNIYKERYNAFKQWSHDIRWHTIQPRLTNCWITKTTKEHRTVSAQSQKRYRIDKSQWAIKKYAVYNGSQMHFVVIYNTIISF